MLSRGVGLTLLAAFLPLSMADDRPTYKSTVIDPVIVEIVGTLTVDAKVSTDLECLLNYHRKTGVTIRASPGFLTTWELLLRDEEMVRFAKANSGKRVFVRGEPYGVWHNIQLPQAPDPKIPMRYVLQVLTIRTADEKGKGGGAAPGK